LPDGRLLEPRGNEVARAAPLPRPRGGAPGAGGPAARGARAGRPRGGGRRRGGAPGVPGARPRAGAAGRRGRGGPAPPLRGTGPERRGGEVSAARRIAGLALAAAALAATTVLSQWPWQADQGGRSLLRISWRARGERIEDCRRATAE